MNGGETDSEYVVIFRATSAVLVRPEDGPFLLENFPAFGCRVRVEAYTRYDEEEFNLPIPRELVIDIRGPAASLVDAVKTFTDVAIVILSPLALSANAPIGEPKLYVAFDNTPGKQERDFLQTLIDDERGLPKTSRYLRVNATTKLVLAILRHREQGRIVRAIEQYRLALSYWEGGKETLAVAHLFMGMEALKVVALRRELAIYTMEMLAERWSVAGRGRNGKVRLGDLQASARREILFQGDKECHDRAEKASSGLEHGFEDLLKVNNLSQEVRESTADYLRTAIFDLCGIPQEAANTLLAEPLRRPANSWRLAYRVRARIVGDSDMVSGDIGSRYPHFTANSNLTLRANEGGGYDISGEQNLTASIGHGLTFQVHSFDRLVAT